MKDLSDSEFDNIFRKRVEESNHSFEEGAWTAMEKKLQKRNRIILLRNTSAVLAACFLIVGLFYFLNRPDQDQQLAKQREEKKEVKKTSEPDPIVGNRSLEEIIKQRQPAIATRVPDKRNTLPYSGQDLFEVINKTVTRLQTPSPLDSSNTVPADTSGKSADIDGSETKAISDATNAVAKTEESSVPSNIKKQYFVKFGLTLSAGPDFNSTTSIAGNKPTLGVGLLLDASITKKISVSTGLRYGGKTYKASAASYGVTNPELLNTITYVDGSCNVLEIPLRTSYELLDNPRKSLKLNAGLSSYLMLKEKYIFKYRPDSYIDDYILEKKNSNQHYLSVADISATYRIKSKASKVEFGIEPYVKIPLGGVGEGKLPLKSSGITLNMFYDLSKKNK